MAASENDVDGVKDVTEAVKSVAALTDNEEPCFRWTDSNIESLLNFLKAIHVFMTQLRNITCIMIVIRKVLMKLHQPT